MSSHLAAVTHAKGQRFEIQSRATPKPGPGELLIEVKSLAINPADGLMRNFGLLVPTYPAVIGFDMAGLVLEVGDNVPTGAVGGDSGFSFQPGVTRVAAYSDFYWKADADHGAFQERCLVPWQHALPLSGLELSWNEAATLPVSVKVPLNAWHDLGIRSMEEIQGPGASSSDGTEREAILIWGASSSVGSMGVQSARLLRDERDPPFAAVYATAGSANHDYVQSLGADRVFDYKDPMVVDAIVAAAKADGLVIRHCYLATGQLAQCQAVLKAFLGEGASTARKKTSKIASAPMVPEDAEVIDGVEVAFILPSTDEATRLKNFHYCMSWARKALADGSIEPSPKPVVTGKGLESLNEALDKVLEGVSCAKLVVEVSE